MRKKASRSTLNDPQVIIGQLMARNHSVLCLKEALNFTLNNLHMSL